MPILVTTSWDDGFPADLQIADILAKHGIRGTFYVPTSNSEGRPVMNPGELRTLSQAFEIGGHGSQHIPLTRFSGPALDSQIADNRDWLAQTLGDTPAGFCYVRGLVNPMVRLSVERCGYRYARTTCNLRPDLGSDPFLLPTTIQFYPHSRSVYIRNTLRQGRHGSVNFLRAALGAPTLTDRILALFEACVSRGCPFHLWGHSWEVEALGLWGELDSVLGAIASSGAELQLVDNAAVARTMDLTRLKAS